MQKKRKIMQKKLNKRSLKSLHLVLDALCGLATTINKHVQHETYPFR
jgi:hypothetical protein